MTPTPKWWIRIPGLLACGFIGTSGQWSGSQAEAAGLRMEASASEASVIETAILESPVDGTGTPESALREDARVRAFLRAYGSLIDSVTYGDDDVVFSLAGQAVHFQDGRMLAEGHLGRSERCDPIFYRYSLRPLTEPMAPSDEAVRYCTDVQEVLWGRTEDQIRGHARSTTFLGRRMFLNDVVIQALGEVERDILSIASDDRAVASWIDDLDITYSFINRGIAGTSTRSQHAWGLAVDLVPSSYEGRQVYWRWSRAWNRRGWSRIPLEQRWSPPETVVEIFERHGFVWGGKWAHFDNIHFEYRPDILEYNRLIEADGQE
jgi:D-alanyl-D-alanine carboxypeptidase-like protein